MWPDFVTASITLHPQGSAQDNLSGGYNFPKVLLNCIKCRILHSVSGGKISLSGGKNF